MLLQHITMEMDQNFNQLAQQLGVNIVHAKNLVVRSHCKQNFMIKKKTCSQEKPLARKHEDSAFQASTENRNYLNYYIGTGAVMYPTI